MNQPHILFVTGKLAEASLLKLLTELAPVAGFSFQVEVLPITVVALATTPWVANHLTIPNNVDRVILPGLCAGELTPIVEKTAATVVRGPKDLRDLPRYLQGKQQTPVLNEHDIAILAEINHAPRLTPEAILEQARKARDDGADVIDLGCDPGYTWSAVSDTVKALRNEGFSLSIDSFNPKEVEAAVKAGAELVLSVNSGNRDAARDWGCETVVIPDDPATLAGLDDTVETLEKAGVPFRIDPILEPIGFGFAASIGRYIEVRNRYPQAEMMMGVGNLTELTDVDSAGLNVMLLGICQELGIRSVLTTEVINWCRSCVRELDLARKLVFHSYENRVLPKHLLSDLVLLRDPKVHNHGEANLRGLFNHIKDRNYRLFAENGKLYILNKDVFLEGTDPFALFSQLTESEDIDPKHAFYLGYELAKAVTALTLGKNYTQDQALRWGFLTVPEISHRGNRE